MLLWSNIHQAVVEPNSAWFRCPGLLSDALQCPLCTWSNYQENDCGFTSLLQSHKQLLPAITCTFLFLVLYATSVCYGVNAYESGVRWLAFLHLNRHLGSQLGYRQLCFEWHFCNPCRQWLLSGNSNEKLCKNNSLWDFFWFVFPFPCTCQPVLHPYGLLRTLFHRLHYQPWGTDTCVNCSVEVLASVQSCCVSHASTNSAVESGFQTVKNKQHKTEGSNSVKVCFSGRHTDLWTARRLLRRYTSSRDLLS